MNFITSSAANGSIGYVEYSYPLGKDYPVAKIENAAGYFTLPTQYNVAVALTQANINNDVNSPDYLLQDLTNVYTYNDPRTYVTVVVLVHGDPHRARRREDDDSQAAVDRRLPLLLDLRRTT